MDSKKSYVMALDEGTTSARAIIFDSEGAVHSTGRYSIPQIFPQPGWVEQDPARIWDSQLRSIKTSMEEVGVKPEDIAALGITNQRETTILWNKRTHKPFYNAVVWQCRRTADAVETLKNEYSQLFHEKTGLVPDSYFSGPKISWMLDNIQGLREKADRGEVLFGTVDSYLIYKLTNGKVHATDYSNASRTLMFNIKELEWDRELLEILGIPESILPEPLPSSDIFGHTDPKILGSSVPIAGVIGDQQAALFGHTAFVEGESKCTYGTGNFLLMNTGIHPKSSDNLLTTVAWGLKGKVTYALEGSIFVTGAAIQWLRDSLGILENAEESEALASSLPNNEGVYFVPALTGLGAPYWNQYAKGTIVGITRGTSRAHIVRAALEAIAYLTKDVVESMEADSGFEVNELRVDGGTTRNNFLMQFQADLLDMPIVRPKEIEITAKGVAYLAGLSVDYWKNLKELKQLRVEAKEFKPKMDATERQILYDGWKAAIKWVLHHKNSNAKNLVR